MKFYNREQELAKLHQWTAQAASSPGQLTMVVGRRRVGKTALLHKAFQERASLYLFVSRKAEALLVEEFSEQIRTGLGIPIFGQPRALREILEILLQFSVDNPFTLVLDEFQDVAQVNSAFFSEMQDLWDRYRMRSRLHLICCGSIYSLMTKLFQDKREPLFGRADHRINLKPLKPSVMASMLTDSGHFTPEKLLQWYLFSGGVPKYVEWLVSSDLDQPFWHSLITEYSLVIEEGHYRLAEEFGPEQAIYFSILAAISTGKTSRPQIESLLETSIGPQLLRLEQDYEIIKKVRPILSKPNSRQVKYEIRDPFLCFWFRFVYRYRSAVEFGNYALIQQAIEQDYATYSGRWLEHLIRDLLAESGRFSAIGSYWESGHKNEIDIVAINEIEKIALIIEVKRNPRKLQLSTLIGKSARLVQQLKGYDIHYEGYSLESLPQLVAEQGGPTRP